MSEWFDDDHEQKVDLRLWRKLLAYTLHYRGTAVRFTVAALVLALSDLGFPYVTGLYLRELETEGLRADITPYVIAYAVLTLTLVSAIRMFILCAGKIRTHVSHDIRRDAFVPAGRLVAWVHETAKGLDHGPDGFVATAQINTCASSGRSRPHSVIVRTNVE